MGAAREDGLRSSLVDRCGSGGQRARSIDHVIDEDCNPPLDLTNDAHLDHVEVRLARTLLFTAARPALVDNRQRCA